MTGAKVGPIRMGRRDKGLLGRGKYLREQNGIGREVAVSGAIKMQITIRLDPDLFKDIGEFAGRERMSFTDAVANLCEWGLEEVRKI